MRTARRTTVSLTDDRADADPRAPSAEGRGRQMGANGTVQQAPTGADGKPITMARCRRRKRTPLPQRNCRRLCAAGWVISSQGAARNPIVVDTRIRISICARRRARDPPGVRVAATASLDGRAEAPRNRLAGLFRRPERRSGALLRGFMAGRTR